MKLLHSIDVVMNNYVCTLFSQILLWNINDICTTITVYVFVNSTTCKGQLYDFILYWCHIYMGAKFDNLGLGPKA